MTAASLRKRYHRGGCKYRFSVLNILCKSHYIVLLIAPTVATDLSASQLRSRHGPRQMAGSGQKKNKMGTLGLAAGLVVVAMLWKQMQPTAEYWSNYDSDESSEFWMAILYALVLGLVLVKVVVSVHQFFGKKERIGGRWATIGTCLLLILLGLVTVLCIDIADDPSEIIGAPLIKSAREKCTPAKTCSMPDINGYFGWYTAECDCLSLSDSDISDSTAQKIARSFHSKLHHVDMRYNYITKEGEQVLRAAGAQHGVVLQIEDQKKVDGLGSRVARGGAFGAMGGLVTGASVGALSVVALPLLAGTAITVSGVAAIGTMGGLYGSVGGAVLGASASGALAHNNDEAKKIGGFAGAGVGVAGGVFAYKFHHEDNANRKWNYADHMRKCWGDWENYFDSRLSGNSLNVGSMIIESTAKRVSSVTGRDFRDLAKQAAAAGEGKHAAHKVDVGFAARAFNKICGSTSIRCDSKTVAMLRDGLNKIDNFDETSCLRNAGTTACARPGMWAKTSLLDRIEYKKWWDSGVFCGPVKYAPDSDTCQEWIFKQLTGPGGVKRGVKSALSAPGAVLRFQEKLSKYAEGLSVMASACGDNSRCFDVVTEMAQQRNTAMALVEKFKKTGELLMAG